MENMSGSIRCGCLTRNRKETLIYIKELFPACLELLESGEAFGPFPFKGVKQGFHATCRMPAER